MGPTLTDLLPILLVIAAAFAIRRTTGRLDCNRIRSYLEKGGNRLVDITWDRFGPGWWGSHGGIYEVTYETRDGQTRRGTCKTSVFGGVYWPVWRHLMRWWRTTGDPIDSLAFPWCPVACPEQRVEGCPLWLDEPSIQAREAVADTSSPQRKLWVGMISTIQARGAGGIDLLETIALFYQKHFLHPPSMSPERDGRHSLLFQQRVTRANRRSPRKGTNEPYTRAKRKD